MARASSKAAPVIKKRTQVQRIFYGLVYAGASLGVLWAAVCLVWPHVLLWSVERALNNAYREHRPFVYRWFGVPYGPLSEKRHSIPQSLLAIELGRLDQAGLFLTKNSRLIQLQGRINLLAENYDLAIKQYQRALLFNDKHRELNLELGIAFALRAHVEKRALDYEFALEHILLAEQEEHACESSFDLAWLFQEIPLPYKGLSQWKLTIQDEHSPEWHDEASSRLKALNKFFEIREQQVEELTSSPASYLVHSGQTGKSIELVLTEALENWLPNYFHDPETRAAMNELAKHLQRENNDSWLAVLLRTPQVPNGDMAFQELAAAWKANLEGKHESAEKFAISAEQLFRRAHNPAGVLRARLERIYSFDRRSLTDSCLQALQGVQADAHKMKYLWIKGQAWLEDITCSSQKQTTGMIYSREQAFLWISGTHYESLRLRALSFMTEEYVCFGSRLTQWQRGRNGLESFWQASLPLTRVQSFYFSLASSAKRNSDSRAAMALREEGVYAVEKSSYKSLLALLLAGLGAEQSEAGLYEKADETFERMSVLFSELATSDKERFWREAEITRAQGEIKSGKPMAALTRIQRLIDDITPHYLNLPPYTFQHLFRVAGDAELALGNEERAADYYRFAIENDQEHLKPIADVVQRQNIEDEVESAWRGISEIKIRHGDTAQSLVSWETFRSGSAENLPLDQIRPPRGGTLLVYAMLPTGLSAWVCNQSDIKQYWLNGIQATHLAEEFSVLVTDYSSSTEEISRIAQQLYKILIKPLAQDLPDTGLLEIDAEGTLAAIPWSALENEYGLPLIDRYSVAQTKGVRNIWKATRQYKIDFETSLILGAPLLRGEIAAQFPWSIETSKEAHHLREQLPHSTFFEGPSATLEAMENYAPRSTTLHFGGHGISNGGFGAIFLASPPGDPMDARITTASEIARLNLNKMQLVVLAACSSGAGEESGAVNLDSLVQGFLTAGASRVVAARWNVNGPQTASLMTNFYDLLLKGQHPTEALRQAALEIRRTPSTAHPYYWAGLQVFGAP